MYAFAHNHAGFIVTVLFSINVFLLPQQIFYFACEADHRRVRSTHLSGVSAVRVGARNAPYLKKLVSGQTFLPFCAPRCRRNKG